MRAGGKLVDEHLLFADAFGRVRTPPVPLDTSRRACRFERGAAAAPLFVGEAPIPGDDLQVVLRGQPGQTWNVFVSAGGAQGPSPLPRLANLAARSGVFGPSGVVDLALPLPGFLPDGIKLWTRALVGTAPTPFAVVTVQGWAAPPPHDAMR
jgi:hypothetical protein